jgi:hypothetical protein
MYPLFNCPTVGLNNSRDSGIESPSKKDKTQPFILYFFEFLRIISQLSSTGAPAGILPTSYRLGMVNLPIPGNQCRNRM